MDVSKLEGALLVLFTYSATPGISLLELGIPLNKPHLIILAHRILSIEKVNDFLGQVIRTRVRSAVALHQFSELPLIQDRQRLIGLRKMRGCILPLNYRALGSESPVFC